MDFEGVADSTFVFEAEQNGVLGEVHRSPNEDGYPLTFNVTNYTNTYGRIPATPMTDEQSLRPIIPRRFTGRVVDYSAFPSEIRYLAKSETRVNSYDYVRVIFRNYRFERRIVYPSLIYGELVDDLNSVTAPSTFRYMGVGKTGSPVEVHVTHDGFDRVKVVDPITRIETCCTNTAPIVDSNAVSPYLSYMYRSGSVTVNTRDPFKSSQINFARTVFDSVGNPIQTYLSFGGHALTRRQYSDWVNYANNSRFRTPLRRTQT